jgi:hypothetical protein
MALRSDDGSSRLAFVFYQRIAWISLMCNVAKASILAVAMAHEIGHVLLPDDSHTPAGLMRGDWDRDDVWKATAGLLQFTDRDAVLIRIGLLAHRP